MPRNPGGTVSGFKLLSTPNAPTITGVTTSIGSASVAFTAPSNTGDGAITSYVVTAVDESSGVSTGATGTSSPITVSPPAGGTFKIRMQALNPYGPGRLTEYDTGNVIYGGVELYNWGGNTAGQLGDNTTISKSSPIQLGSSTSWAAAGGGSGFSLAAKTDGTLWGWGNNGSGRLGDSTTVNKSSPVQIGALTNWYLPACGTQHGMAVKTDGTLWTWGNNSSGQLGLGDTVSGRISPNQVGALTNWEQADGGDDLTLAVKTDGTIWGWGDNLNGQVGDNSNIKRSSPVQIGALTNWVRVAAGQLHAMAVKTDGTLWTWGYSGDGALGQNDTTRRSSPTQVGVLANWAYVAGGERHTVASKTNGELYAWGKNNRGELGDGTTTNRSSPVQIGALTDWKNVAAKVSEHSVATKTNGTLWAWGYNFSGQIGDGSKIARSSPVQVGALTDWISVSTGTTHTLALYGVV